VGCQLLTLSVIDQNADLMDDVNLNDEDWYVENPLTTTVTASCPAGRLFCQGDLNFSMGTSAVPYDPLSAARFNVITSTVDFSSPTDEQLNGECTVDRFDDPANSFTTFRYALDCPALRLSPNESVRFDFTIWVQPSVEIPLDIQATWDEVGAGYQEVTKTLQLPLAHIHPLIFLPGYLGTFPPRPGGPIEPLQHTYDNLIEALRVIGYEAGMSGSRASLVLHGYDYRTSLKSTGTGDIANLVAQIRSYPSGLFDYIDFAKIDFVTHSTGGLIARAYVEDSNRHNEQNVHQMTLIASPNRGIPYAYEGWYGGNPEVLGLMGYEFASIVGANAYCDAQWQGVEDNFNHITTAAIRANLYEYIHEYAPSVQGFLPPGDYIPDMPRYLYRDGDIADVYPFGQPASPFQTDLNSHLLGNEDTLDVNKLIQPDLKIYALYGSGNPDSNRPTWGQLGVIEKTWSNFTRSVDVSLVKQLGLYNTLMWQYGIPVSYQNTSGDSLVPADSGNLKFVPALNWANNIHSVDEGDFTHTGLVEQPQAVQIALKHLTGRMGEDDFYFWTKQPPGETSYSPLFVSCAPDLRILIEDINTGLEAGHDLISGSVINQIPGSYVSAPGEEHQWIFVPFLGGSGHYMVHTAVTAPGQPYNVGVIIPGPNGEWAVRTLQGDVADPNTSYDFTFQSPVIPLLSADTFVFDMVPVGSSQTRILTITNAALDRSLPVGELSLSGEGAAHFTLQNNTCVQQVLAPGQSCTVNILFSPLSLGEKIAALSLLTNNDELQTTISLMGGLPPVYLPVIFKNASGTPMLAVPAVPEGIFNSPLPIPTPTPVPVTIETLITGVDTACQQGKIDNQGVRQSLEAKLAQVEKHINDGEAEKATNQLQAFINEVQAQRGKHIAVETADQLLALSGQLMAQLRQ
jgi:hypothetical protein